jgi:hypothetical protein
MGANFEQKIGTKEDLSAAGVVAVYRQAWAESSVETALYRPKFRVVGFAVSLRTQYSSFV